MIDHGSPSPSPPPLPLLDELPPAAAAFTKEEWLRIGGFIDSDTSLSSSLYSATPYDELASSSTFANRPQPGELPSPTYTFPSTSAPVDYPTQLPTPSWAPLQTPALPYPLPPAPSQRTSPSRPPPVPSVLQPFGGETSQPPPELYPSTQPYTSSAPVKKPSASRPARNRKRTAPSPVALTHVRPSPYPARSTSPPPSVPTSDILVLPELNPAPKIPPTAPESAFSTFSLTPLPVLPPTLDPSKKSHARKTSVGHIPRPRNAFILFRSHAVTSKMIPAHLGVVDHRNISQVVGALWRGLGAEEKSVWERMAEEEKRLHREKYPNYVYRPKAKGVRKPVGQGKKAMMARMRELDEDEEEDAEIPEDDEEWEPKRVTRGTRSRPKSPVKQEADEGRQPDDRKSARRMSLIAQALLEGEDDDAIEERVESELAATTRITRSKSPAKAAPASASTPRRPRPKPYSSPTSDIRVNSSPASSTSTASPSRDSSGFRHSRLARRSSGGPWHERSNINNAGSPSSSPAAKSPLSTSHGRPSLQHSSTKSKDLGYTSLGVASPDTVPSPFDLPPLHQSRNPSGFLNNKNLYVAGFDNSPLLGSGVVTDRRSSLGRWELRKPSTTMSRREMMAQEDEVMLSGGGYDAGGDEDGRGRTVSKAFTIDPRLFLAESGLEDELDLVGSSSSSHHHHQPPPPPPNFAHSSSSSSSTFRLPTPPSTYATTSTTRTTYAPQPDMFHFGSQDLFSAPPDPFVGGRAAKARGGSNNSSNGSFDFGLQYDNQRGSTYLGE